MTPPDNPDTDEPLTDAQIISKAMSLLARAQPTETRRANMLKAQLHRREPKPCNCGKTPHHHTCVVYKRERLRAWRSKQANP
jgi:hypothetical protein